MATQVPTSSEPGFAHLVRGIVNDIGDLVKQQIQFARAEIKEDVRKSKEACVLLALGAGSAFAGVLFLGLMLVHLLHWLTAPSHTDPSSLPLWGCYAIVAGVFPTPAPGILPPPQRLFAFSIPEQTVQTAKENVEWITNSK